MRSLAVAAVLCCGCASLQPPPAPATTTLRWLEQCDLGEVADDTIRCGELDVPEDWDSPSKRAITLFFMVLPARKGGTDRLPLMDLAGGPGAASTMAAGFYSARATPFRDERDVVLLDQRGTGRSTPLRCPEIEHASNLDRMYPPEAVRACAGRLASTHDLSAFNTLAAARDVDALRSALGYGQVDLLGTSYGTRLAQVVMREFPQAVRSVVLAGTVPMDFAAPLGHAPNAQDTLEAIFRDCAKDKRCRRKYPRLRRDWAKTLRAFAGGSLTVKTDSGSREIARGPFMEAVRNKMLTEPGQRRLPKWIGEMKSKPARTIEELESKGSGFIAEGLYLTVECAEGAPLIDEAKIAATTEGTFLGRYRVDEQLGACALWPVEPGVDAEPIRSDIPTLLIAGGRDYVAPVEYARRVAKGLSRHRLVVIEELAHLPAGISNIECFDTMMLEFYATADPDAVDTTCTEEMKAPPFE